MRELCLPFYTLFCLFFLFLQLYSQLCALKKRKNILKKTYKNFKDINLNNFLVSLLQWVDIKIHCNAAESLFLEKFLLQSQ